MKKYTDWSNTEYSVIKQAGQEQVLFDGDRKCRTRENDLHFVETVIIALCDSDKNTIMDFIGTMLSDIAGGDL